MDEEVVVENLFLNPLTLFFCAASTRLATALRFFNKRREILLVVSPKALQREQNEMAKEEFNIKSEAK